MSNPPSPLERRRSRKISTRNVRCTARRENGNGQCQNSREPGESRPRCSTHQVEYEASLQAYHAAGDEADQLERELTAIRRELASLSNLSDVVKGKEVVEAYLTARRREHSGRNEHTRLFFNSRMDDGHKRKVRIVESGIAKAERLLKRVKRQEAQLYSLRLEADALLDTQINEQEEVVITLDPQHPELRRILEDMCGHQLSDPDLQYILEAVWGYHLGDPDPCLDEEDLYSPPDSPPGLEPIALSEEQRIVNSFPHSQGLTWDDSGSPTASPIPYSPDSPPDSPPELEPIGMFGQGVAGRDFDQAEHPLGWSPGYREKSSDESQLASGLGLHNASNASQTPFRQERETIDMRGSRSESPSLDGEEAGTKVAVATRADNDNGLKGDTSTDGTWSWGKVVGALAVVGAAAFMLMRGRNGRRAGF